MYVAKTSVIDEHEWWSNTFSSVVDELKLKTQQFNKSSMYCFDVEVFKAPLHNNIYKGDYSVGQLESFFNRGEGFSVSFLGTQTKLSISWKKMLHSSSTIMLYTSPLPRTRRTYAKLFKNAGTITLLRRIFHCVSHETAGDYSASAALMIAYQKKERDVLKDMLKKSKIKTAEELCTCTREEVIPDGGSLFFTTSPDTMKLSQSGHLHIILERRFHHQMTCQRMRSMSRQLLRPSTAITKTWSLHWCQI
jgi:hypothetical protein